MVEVEAELDVTDWNTALVRPPKRPSDVGDDAAEAEPPAAGDVESEGVGVGLLLAGDDAWPAVWEVPGLSAGEAPSTRMPPRPWGARFLIKREMLPWDRRWGSSTLAFVQTTEEKTSEA